MIFVAGADDEGVFDWEVPAGLFSDQGEMVWEPERWEPGSANDQEWEADDQEWDKQSAQKGHRSASAQTRVKR